MSVALDRIFLDVEVIFGVDTRLRSDLQNADNGM